MAKAAGSNPAKRAARTRGKRSRATRGRQGWKNRGRRIPSKVAEESSAEEELQEEFQHAKDLESPIHFQQLTSEQQMAAQRALAGENLFLTGAAGTGKSFLLRYLIKELEQRYPEKVAVTASTGVAASHLAGQTLHSFAGIGIGCSTLRMALKKVRQTSGAEARWTQTRVLVVDEISMVDAKLLDLLEGLACNLRGNRSAAFGGLQVLLCGDFLQLPPVQERGTARAFCFNSNAWQKANLHQGTVLLRQAVRQQGDHSFAQVLNEMRLGLVSENAKVMLESCHVAVKPQPADDILPTKLYCLNRDVDRENAARLAQLPGSARVLKSRDRIPRRTSAAQRAALDRKVPEKLSLKVGAQVIHLCNDPAMGLVNGHRGRVEAFEAGKPVVRFDNGKRICIGVHKFTQGQGSKSLERYQVPLKLGWALTVHKAQGMTLTRAELQLDNVFEAGQSYVALSRLTGTQGLWIRGKLNLESSCRAHPDVLRYYQEAKPMAPQVAPATVDGKAEAVESATLHALPGPQGKRPAPPSFLERLERKRKVPQAALPSDSKDPSPGKAKKSTSHSNNWVTPLRHWCDPIEID